MDEPGRGLSPDAVWGDLVVIERSYIDTRVWVPWTTGYGDQSCFLNAGGFRAVRAWAEREAHTQFPDLPNRWVKQGRDHWTLQVLGGTA